MIRHGEVPNRGGDRPSARAAGDTLGCVLSGPLRWVGRDGSYAALRVADGTGRARRLIGTTVTLELSDTAVAAADRNGDGRRDGRDLLPGDHVTVRARLPLRPPEVIAPRRIAAW